MIRNFTIEQFQDFRIPIEIFKNNCSNLHRIKLRLKDKVLRAVGIDADGNDVKIDWDTFLLIHKIFTLDVRDRELILRFAVKLFDPLLSGYVKDCDFE